ncbi:MAG: hypothetical protein AB1736_13780 [Chloroflexota bacterium]
MTGEHLVGGRSGDAKRRPGLGRRFARLPLAIIALIFIIGGAGLLAIPNLLPGPAPAPPRQPLLVTANQAGGARQAHVGYPIPITAHALGGSAIRALELWHGDRRIAQSLSTTDAPAFHARWSWTPREPGDAILIARAIDVTGRVAQSNLVRLHVAADPPPMVDLREITAAEGETLAGIAGRAGADPVGIRRWNDDLDPLTPLAAGTVVLVPVPIPAPPPPADDFDELVELAADIEAVFAPPNLTTTVTGCLVDVAVNGGSTEADGFALYQADPSSLVFANVKSTGATGGTSYQTEAVTGTYVFSASSFIGTVEVQSDPVVVEIPEGCAGNGWTGEATIVGGRLLVGQAVDRAYLYASVDKGPWERVPATPGTFIEPDLGGLDVSPYFTLPPGAEELQINAWGWQGPKLVDLGSGHWEVDRIGSASFGMGTTLDGLVKIPVVARLDDGPAGDMAPVAHVENPADAPAGAEAPQPSFGSNGETVTLYRSSTVERPYDDNDKQAIKRDFGWTSYGAGIDHVVWQVLPYPTSTTPDLGPPFLIDQGVAGIEQGQPFGEFTIDFRPYFGGVPDVDSYWASNAASQTVQQLIGGPYFPGGGGAATPSPTSAPTIVPKLPVPDHFYVRIIPMKGLTPVGQASNYVRFDVVDKPPPVKFAPGPPDYTKAFTSLGFGPVAPMVGDASYARCVLVVDTPNHGTYTAFWGQYTPNKTVICYQPPDDDGWSPFDVFESFVEFVSDVWDAIADGFAWIKQQVVSAIVALSQCDAVASDSVCQGLASAAVDALLISAGIPPSIPDFDAAVEALKGDLATVIVEEAYGVVPGMEAACTASDALEVASCEALVEAAIDKAVGYVEQVRSDAAAKNAGVFVPPGVTVVPHPKGQWQPPQFLVTATRTTDPTVLYPENGCGVAGSLTSTLYNHTWMSVADYKPVQKSGTVSGVPFTSEVAPLNPEPGKTAQRTIWLTSGVEWFEDHGAKVWSGWNEGSNGNHAWKLLMPGAQLKYSLSSLCSTSKPQATITLSQAGYNL